MNIIDDTIRKHTGNVDAKKLFRAFLNSKERCVIILGASGLGKTTFCNLFFEQFDYNVIRPFYELFNSHKEFATFLENSINNNDIVNKKRKILFLDDIDVLFTTDRYASSYINTLLQSLTKIQTKKRNQNQNQNQSQYNINEDLKIVITCNINDEKRLSDLKKKNRIIRLRAPSFDECHAYIIWYIEKSKIKLRENTNITDLILAMGCNIRNILINLKMFCKDGEREKKCKDHNIFEICHSILSEPYLELNDLNCKLSLDPTLISYILFDNFKQYIHRNYDCTDEIYFQGLSYIMKCYIYGSILETHMYNSCSSWNIIEGANLIKCGSIKLLQSSLNIKNKIQNDRESNLVSNYTIIPTRSSQHFSLLRKLQKYVSYYDIDIENAFLSFEVMYLKMKMKKNKKEVYSSISDELTLINVYINNICQEDVNPFGKKMIRFKNTLIN